MSLLLDYPWYFVLFCLLLGVVYAALLYFVRVRRGAERDFSRRLTFLLAVIRTLSVATIAFLLLSPLVKRVANRKEKPLVIIAQDNSQSLRYCPDSAYYASEFQESLSRLASNLASDFDVQRYSYGQSLVQLDAENPNYNDVFTDIAQAINEVDNIYYHRNVGAIILTGDGIFNRGSNPVNLASSLSYPIYTVAMGDTTIYRDAAVAHIRCNRIAYLGNSFPMEVTVVADRMKGERASLSLSCDGRKLETKELSFDNDHFSATFNFLINADREGMRHYQIALSPLSDEKSLQNNRQSVMVEVVDGHQKVAIIAAAPHPDIAAIKAALESNQNFDVETFIGRDFNKRPQDYNLLILHQLPAKSNVPATDVSTLVGKGTPALFILGGLTDLPRLNALHAGVEVFARIERTNEVTALPNNNFTYFVLPDETSKRITSFPPLLSPFGDYKVGGNGQTLLFSKVGNVNSGLPLVAVGQNDGLRYAFVTGEGLWRWRLSDWQQYGTHDDFDQLLSKIVSFTALRLDKERLHVETKHLFGQNEPVVIDAQLYNENYEMVNTPDVELLVERTDFSADAESSSNGKDRKSSYQFNRRGDGYSVNIGSLSPGSYRYTARTTFNGQQLAASGGFVVEEINIEAANTVADHSLLNTMASLSGGEMVAARDVESLAEKIRSRDDLHTVIFSETTYGDMLNMPLVFILIVLLLAVEWIIRKYNGTL